MFYLVNKETLIKEINQILEGSLSVSTERALTKLSLEELYNLRDEILAGFYITPKEEKKASKQ